MYVRLINRFGLFRILLGIILLTDIMSGLFTYILLTILQGSVDTVELAAAILLPTIIAPFVVYTSLRNIQQMHKMERELQDQNRALQAAFGEIKQLGGLLPICASCKKVRDDSGYWNQLETYISSHSDVQFSHGVCPECFERLYPGQKASSLSLDGESHCNQ